MTASPGASSVSAPGEIRIGISSWGDLPGFYPSGIKAGDKLAWYARFFSVVEVNVSFYRLVPARTYSQWIDATPPGLVFDIKAFGDLTHGTAPPASETFRQFRDSYLPVREAGRLGAILFQFPPRFSRSEAAIDTLRRVAAEMSGDLVAVEFRNHSWLTDESAPETLALLRELGLAYAIADEPQIPAGSVPPLPAVTNADLAYLRLHGRNAEGWLRGDRASRYDYDYSIAELTEWQNVVTDLSREVRQVHVLFNNNARGAGTRNAIRLSELLGIEPSDAPDLPLAQTSLFGDS